jgi:hypothetical protein
MHALYNRDMFFPYQYYIFNLSDTLKEIVVKDEKYVTPSGKELHRRMLANKEKVLAEVRNEAGEFVKYVKTQKGTNPMDSFF